MSSAYGTTNNGYQQSQPAKQPSPRSMYNPNYKQSTTPNNGYQQGQPPKQPSPQAMYNPNYKPSTTPK